MIITEILRVLGFIDFIAPAFEPVMTLLGLPPEAALALVGGLLVGLWKAAMLLFLLVPLSELSTADVTVFSCLVLVAHALPVEQQIIKRAGPSFLLTTALRFFGGFLFAGIMHALFTATGWLSEPVAPVWIPISDSTGWLSFLIELAKSMGMMLLILSFLIFVIDGLKAIGVMGILNAMIAPVLRLVGIRGEAVNLTAVGIFLGISFGGGLLIKEARSGLISKDQVLLSCVFMGFAHSMIEDTLFFMALGADPTSIIVGRLVFAMVATGLFFLILTSLRARQAINGAATG